MGMQVVQQILHEMAVAGRTRRAGPTIPEEASAQTPAATPAARSGKAATPYTTAAVTHTTTTTTTPAVSATTATTTTRRTRHAQATTTITTTTEGRYSTSSPLSSSSRACTGTSRSSSCLGSERRSADSSRGVPVRPMPLRCSSPSSPLPSSPSSLWTETAAENRKAVCWADELDGVLAT